MFKGSNKSPFVPAHVRTLEHGTEAYSGVLEQLSPQGLPFEVIVETEHRTTDKYTSP